MKKVVIQGKGALGPLAAGLSEPELTDLTVPVNPTLVPELSRQDAEANLARDLAEKLVAKFRRSGFDGRVAIRPETSVRVLECAVALFREEEFTDERTGRQFLISLELVIGMPQAGIPSELWFRNAEAK